MFQKIKLRGKIVGSISVVLFLLIAVAYVGFNGLSSILARSEKVSHVYDLVQAMLETRQYEKEFMIKGTPEAAEQVLKNISALKVGVYNISESFSNKSNRELFEKVGAQVDGYQQAFSRYKTLKADMAQTLGEMQSSADIAMQAIQDFREVQNNELVDIRKKGQAALVSQTNKTEQINDIINRIMENSAIATQLIYDFDTDKMEILVFDHEEVLRLVAELKLELKDPVIIERLNDTLAKYQENHEALKDILESEDGSKDIDGFLEKSKQAVWAGLKVRVSFVAQQEKMLAATDEQMDDRLANTSAANQLYARFNNILRQEKDFIINADDDLYSRIITGLGELVPEAKALATKLKSRENISKIQGIIGDVTAFQQAFVRYNLMVEKQREAADKMLTAAVACQELCGEARNIQKTEMTLESDKATGMMFGGTLVAFVIGALLAFVTARIITKSLHNVITGLTESSQRVSHVSVQLADASHSLADGSSQQAASVEETSSSLEEMASMTKQNASHAAHADNLMKETKQIVTNANTTMTQLTGAMGEASTASAETSKIIKTIDEIAFQTNLLALNAAVEAARAGEAGAGFAVVADEVRNLAIRAAEAAKSTSSLIDQTGRKVEESANLVSDTEHAFVKVTESATKVAELISEIAHASNEQAQGIGQVNQAVTEMDSIIQQNVANSEESAGATEELNTQVRQLEVFIGNLVSLVGKQGETHGRKQTAKKSDTPSSSKALAGPETSEKMNVKNPVAKYNEKTPEELIPLDDDDLAGF